MGRTDTGACVVKEQMCCAHSPPEFIRSSSVGQTTQESASLGQVERVQGKVPLRGQTGSGLSDSSSCSDLTGQGTVAQGVTEAVRRESLVCKGVVISSR